MSNKQHQPIVLELHLGRPVSQSKLLLSVVVVVIFTGPIGDVLPVAQPTSVKALKLP